MAEIAKMAWFGNNIKVISLFRILNYPETARIVKLTKTFLYFSRNFELMLPKVWRAPHTLFLTPSSYCNATDDRMCVVR